MTCREVLERLAAMGSPESRAGMARYGIVTDQAFGVSIPHLRRLAREIGTDHDLALDLWDSQVHEARILASMIADPARCTPALMNRWAGGFATWDVCDQVCTNYFVRSVHTWSQAQAWTRRREEFIRRAGFALIACLAVHDKDAEDAAFLALLPFIEDAATDPRNYVRKAVNWALRQIGKRNTALNRKAVIAARRILRTDDRTARWIAADALRELTSPAVRQRLAAKRHRPAR